MGKHGEEEEYFRYDVFISFRGEDIRHTVLRQLREGLGRRGILSFHDDRDMRIGTGLSLALREAIAESNVFIVVFSENYASSTWCLDELVKIIQRTHMNSKQIFFLPVFYHVDPSDIQKIRNSFGKHMTAHEEFGEEPQKVQAWRSALSEAANLPGMHITTTTRYVQKQFLSSCNYYNKYKLN
ncbi:hypothetical protein LR48_Vigan2284s000100 [Vigna angularis]|nr:hypothetical protein LR48_Vigan2284s000100 [Vigna angularis]